MPTDNALRTCSVKGCGKQFIRKQGTPRTKCFDCAPDRTKPGNSKIISANFGGNQDQQGENGEIQDQEGPMTRMSRLRLEELEVADTWQAAAVMALAIGIDEGKLTGTAGLAGMIRGHREAMSVAEAISTVERKENVISWIFAEDA